MDSWFGTVWAWLGFYLHCLWTVDLVLSEPGQGSITLPMDSWFGTVWARLGFYLRCLWTVDLLLSEPGQGSTYIVYGQWICYCLRLVRVLLTLSMDSGFGTVWVWLGFYLHCLWTVDLVLSEPGQGSTYIVYGQVICYCLSLVRVLLTLSMDSGFGTVWAWLGFYLHCLCTVDLILSEPG